MHDRLTSYGLSVLSKQMSAGSKYGAAEVDVTCLDDDAFAGREANPFADDDPDLADHPRFRTAEELRGAMPAATHGEVKVFCVELNHTVNNNLMNPHFVLLHDKVEGRECFKAYRCTCDSGIRCGVPCRHYWAVMRHSTAAAFHGGLVNDLWFKEAQPLSVSVVGLHTFDDPCNPFQPVEYQRPLYPGVNLSGNGRSEDARSEELSRTAKGLSEKRLWGQLLGEAKKAIERSIDLGCSDGLYATLHGFASATGATGAGRAGTDLLTRTTTDLQAAAGTLTVQNPDVVRGKGRPKGTTRVVQSGQRSMVSRPPLQPVGYCNVNGANGSGVQVDGPGGSGGEPGAGSEDGTQLPTTAGERPAKRPRKCGKCGQLGFHNARTCRYA